MRVSLDTNVLVRLVTGDDPAQARAAKDHLEGKDIYLAKTVLLESEWVLRHAYELPRAEIARVFRLVLGLEKLIVEAAGEAATALAWYEQGLDFADALHLASSAACDHLVTFDRSLAATASRLGLPTSVHLL
jgi:predicted nucleic-acid-binding protein